MFRRFNVLGLFCVVSFSVTLGFALFATGATQVPGCLPGSFTVNELNGAAEYTIPIRTPVGIKGIEPQLSLRYSSQSGNGMLGVGWSLAGIPVITRKSTVAMRDGITHQVDYTADDRFALNGNTLICVSGTYGADGAVYRTERDEFARIVSYGTAGAGPSYFKVWTKDGRIMEFGNTTDSKRLAVDRADVAAWPMNKLQDRCGNSMTVAYFGNTQGEYYATRIDYGYSPTARCSVVFEYEARQDSMISYAQSSLVKMTDRLHAIKTYVGSQMILNYKLGYEYGGAARKSRLINITQYDSSGNNLPPTTFTYKTNIIGYQLQNWGTYSGSYDIPVHSAKVGDFNGDGKAELVIRSKETIDGIKKIRTYVFIPNGNGGFTRLIWLTESYDWTYDPNCTSSSNTHIGDFNGDGLSDLLVVDMNSIARVYLSDGQKFNGPYQWSTDGKIYYEDYLTWGKNKYTRLGDFNGDGLTDIISLTGVGTYNLRTYVWTSNGSGFDLHQDWFPDGNPGLTLGDFNGDGMTDCISVQENPEVWFATGSGFNHVLNYGNISYYPGFPPNVIDINGDGRTDIMPIQAYLSSGHGLHLFEGGGPCFIVGDANGDGVLDSLNMTNQDLHIWNGHGYEEYENNNLGWEPGLIDQPADFLGCGKASVASQSVLYGYQIDVAVPKDPAKEDIITSITDGLGKQVAITYKPITDNTIYQKYSDAPYPTIRDYQGAIYVVSGFTVTDGIGGVNSYSYTYAGARIDSARRELLGFQSTTMKDLQTNITTTSTYLQGFPFSGLLKSRTVSLVNGTNVTDVSEMINDYNVQCYNNGVLTETRSEAEATEWFIYNSPGVPSRTYFPCLSISLKEEYSINGTFTLVTSSTEEYSYLEYGNLQQKVTTVMTKTGSTTTDTFQQTDDFEYLPSDLSNWVIGLVSRRTIQATNNQGVTETRTTSYEYDTDHFLMERETVEPTGNQAVKLVREYEYADAYFNNTGITETGYNGTATGSRITTLSYAYDAVEFHITKTNPEGLVESFDHDWATGKVTAYTDPNGLMTEWYYDDFGRPTEEDRPDDTKTIYTYSTGGAVAGAVYSLKTQVYDSNNNGLAPVTTSFDKLDREIYQETQAQNGQIIFKNTLYNKRSLVETASRYHFSGGNAQNTSFIYDVLGRVSSQTSYNSGTATYVYNVGGYNNFSVTNAKGQTTTQTTNAVGKLCKVVDSLGKTISYTYTPFGDLKQVKDALNNTTNLVYDIRGRRTQVADPDMGTWNYEYNAFGDLVKQTDARGNVVQMTYDKLSRVKTKTSGGQAYNWTYDTSANGIGKPAGVTGPAYQETYTYDSLGRPQDTATVLEGTGYTVTSSYDSHSRLIGLTYPGSGAGRFSVAYQYTANGYLEKVKNSSTGFIYWTASTRNALGQVTQETLGNGLTTTNTFDTATGRLTGINTNGAQSLTYTYDAIGNLNTRKNNLRNLTETFTYDTANRLTTVSGPQIKMYTYNEIGNILKKLDVSANNYVYGSARPHAVTTAGTVNYTYDANGNMISDNSGRTIAFDEFNRPTQLARTGASGTLTYDAYGALIKQVLTQGSVTTSTIYLGDLFEKVTTGSVTEYKHYIVAEGQKVAIHTSQNDGTCNTFYLHRDHLGSTDATTNALGNVVDSLSYDPFGMRRNAATWQDQAGITCTTTDYGYTGHVQLDAFGLIQMGARIYDPKLGRFISPDNVVQNVADSQALNRYSYCANNPLRYVDPTGNTLVPLSDASLGGVYIGGTFDLTGFINSNNWAQSEAIVNFNPLDTQPEADFTSLLKEEYRTDTMIDTTGGNNIALPDAVTDSITDTSVADATDNSGLINSFLGKSLLGPVAEPQLYADAGIPMNIAFDVNISSCFRDVSDQQAVVFGKTLLTFNGTPYGRGKMTPGLNGRMDCSGAMLVGIERAFGLTLPRFSADGLINSPYARQLGQGESPRTGDLVHWPGHVVCYYPGLQGGKDFIGAHGEGTPFGPGKVQSTSDYFNTSAQYYRLRLPCGFVGD